MIKQTKKLELNRETLQRLDRSSLGEALGGIFPKAPGRPVSVTTCVCTFTCAGCLPPVV